MSLMLLAVEYLILHTVFETIRRSDERVLEKDSTNINPLSTWEPLSDYQLYNIRKLTG